MQNEPPDGRRVERHANTRAGPRLGASSPAGRLGYRQGRAALNGERAASWPGAGTLKTRRAKGLLAGLTVF